jgi:hypothetical protein
MTICQKCGRNNVDGTINCELCGASMPISQNSLFEKITKESGLIRFPHPPSTVTTPHPVIRQQAIMTGKLTLNDTKEFILSGKEDFLIGRVDVMAGITPDIDLTEADIDMVTSRKHARILKKGSLYSIEDLESTNFTFLNGRMLSPRVPTKLDDGDVIRIGKIYLVFSRVKTEQQ